MLPYWGIDVVCSTGVVLSAVTGEVVLSVDPGVGMLPYPGVKVLVSDDVVSVDGAVPVSVDSEVEEFP